MARYIIKRILFSLVTGLLFAFLIHLVFTWASFEKYTRMSFNEYMPLAWENFKTYLMNILRDNNWGYTYEGLTVWENVGDRIPISLRINVIAFAIYFFGGTLIGLICALYKGSIFDRIMVGFFSIFSSIPIHVFTFFLIAIFGWVWRIATIVYLDRDGFVFSNYFIPVTAITIVPMTYIFRLFRAELLETKTEDYILLARAKGMSEKRAMLRHSLRASILPVIGELPTIFVGALTGSFVVEVIYKVPGVAELMYRALIQLSPVGTWYVRIDIGTMMVLMLYYVGLSIAFGLAMDILIAILDPRIRLQKS